MRANTPVANTSVANSPVDGAALKDSLNLPKTDFPMRPGLATLEPRLLEEWNKGDLYRHQRRLSEGRPMFTLHDGPPYANGHLHMGHALNKVLKDMVVRSQQMSGKDARFVPGWDCHGLPVEWKVEQQYRSRKLSKEDVPVLEFRQACRDYARKWVDVQKAEFQRLGVNANWDHPYMTMDASSEAAVAREFMKFLMNSTLYQSSKPVMWSPVEKTALAEAEVEYQDRKTTAAWVAYPVAPQSSPYLDDAYALAWTTTPWTLPSSAALCFAADLSYGLYELHGEDHPSHGMKLLLCDEAADRAAQAMGAELKRLRDVPAYLLSAARVLHPFHRLGEEWAEPLPVLPAEHVRADAGSGLVHTAPSHGEDDYKVGRKHGLPMAHNLTDDGRLRDDMPVFGGLAVVKQDGSKGPADAAVLYALEAEGHLLAEENLKHSYPHSWRSKAPVLFRATPQWFVSVDKPVGDGQDRLGTTLRERALGALDEVQWLPAASKNRLAAMLRDRPDWVLSRQRAWGVPLTLFLRRDLTPDHPDFVLRDDKVNARVLEAFNREGADAWYQDSAKDRFLSPDYDPDLYDQCFDVLDVWFESGASSAFVLRDREDGPEDGMADLHLEGTDQHRGWFQASLLHGVGTKGQAPFRAVLTHGFALDGKGRKMSKSLGNVVSPEKVVKQHGAEVLRMWVSQADYTRDFKAGDDALKGAAETFRKLRNTLRYMLGALNGHDPKTPVSREAMPLLERWVMHRASEVAQEVENAYGSYDFADVVQTVHDFANFELSSLLFEVRKDVLYCDATDGPRRQALLSTMSMCLDACLKWLAPVLVFTTEEAWRTRHGTPGVHLQQFSDLSEWRDESTVAPMARMLDLRDLSNAALEVTRTSGGLTKSTHARLSFCLSSEGLPDGVTTQDLADFCVVAQVELVGQMQDGYTLDRLPGAQVHVADALGEECPRCRLVSAETHSESGLCPRCHPLVAS